MPIHDKAPSVVLSAPPHPHSLTGITVINCHNSHSRSVRSSVVIVVVVCGTSCGLMCVCMFTSVDRCCCLVLCGCVLYTYTFSLFVLLLILLLLLPPATTTTAPSSPRAIGYSVALILYISPARLALTGVASYPSSPRQKKVACLLFLLRCGRSPPHGGSSKDIGARCDSYPDDALPPLPISFARHIRYVTWWQLHRFSLSFSFSVNQCDRFLLSSLHFVALD